MRISFSFVLLLALISSAVLLVVFQHKLGSDSQPLSANSFWERLIPEEVRAKLAGSQDGWQPVGSGVEYRAFMLPDPNRVYVARMDRSNLQVSLESSIGQGRLSGGLETVASMAARYEQTISYWGQNWGGRNDVIVAINGSFFGPTNEPAGVPWRGQIHSSWYAKRFDNLENGSGFVWKADRSAFIGECITHVPNKQFIQVQSSGKTIEFHGINVPRGSSDIIIYTPQFDERTLTSDSGLEILVELSQPMLIPGSLPVTGTARAIFDGQGDNLIPFDHIILSAGSSKKAGLAGIQVGEQIEITQKIKHFEEDCSSPHAIGWEQSFASLGGSFYFLEDRKIKSFSDPGATNRAPRTAIAFNNDYIYFIVVDGRDPGWSEGMTTNELGQFSRDTLGAAYGIAQDGGGSATLVVNGQVMNNTFCNNYFCKSKVFLPVVTGGGGGAPASSMKDSQRSVANGMMMVVVEPAGYSSALIPGQPIQTLGPVELRLGPGNNYGSAASLAAGSQGSIAVHHLNGIQATGSHWWKVEIAGKAGWLAETDFGSNP